jgi:two-component SAPR family response regulator
VKVRQRNEQLTSPLFIYEKVEQLIDDCIPPQTVREYTELLAKYSGVLTEKKKRDFVDKKREFEKENGIELFRIHLRMYLASKTLIEHYKLTDNLVLGLIEEIKTKFYQSLAPAG